MIIVGLKKKGNDVTIVFDDGTYHLIDYRLVVDKGLWKGQEIDENKIELLSYESSILKAKDSSFRYLGMRTHSSFELKIKLQKKKFSPEIIKHTLEYLQQNKYLNDEDFVKQFVLEKINKKKIGSALLTAELMKKGINRELIKVALSGLDKELYLENALTLAKRKLFQITRKVSDKSKITQKLYSFLSSKGYENEIILNVVEKLKIDKEE